MIDYTSGHFAVGHPLHTEVNERFSAQKPFSSADFSRMTDTEHAAVLHHSANLQRYPEDAVTAESAMLDIQKQIGGLFGFSAEHVGDLYWRANHMHGGTWGTLNEVDRKVNKTLSDLQYPYKYHTNIEADVSNDRTMIGKAQHLGKLYALEHSKLPIYTYPSQLATEAAQHLGNFRFGAAAGALTELGQHVLHPDANRFDTWTIGNRSPEEVESFNNDIENMHKAWKEMHSREATISFLRSQGR